MLWTGAMQARALLAYISASFRRRVRASGVTARSAAEFSEAALR